MGNAAKKLKAVKAMKKTDWIKFQSIMNRKKNIPLNKRGELTREACKFLAQFDLPEHCNRYSEYVAAVGKKKATVKQYWFDHTATLTRAYQVYGDIPELNGVTLRVFTLLPRNNVPEKYADFLKMVKDKEDTKPSAKYSAKKKKPQAKRKYTRRQTNTNPVRVQDAILALLSEARSKHQQITASIERMQDDLLRTEGEIQAYVKMTEGVAAPPEGVSYDLK